MHFKHLITALAAFSSLAAAAPAQDSKATASQRRNANQNGKKNNKGQNRNNNNNNGGLTIVQNIQPPNIIVVQENLDQIDQLQRQNEQELAALVQSQIALSTQLQAVKDNIRINHFKAQFPQANTVIVAVTGLADNRAPGNRKRQGDQNMRYLVNQLLADNGQPDKQTLVMIQDPTPMQISTEQAASSMTNAFGASRVALDSPIGASLNATAGPDVKSAAVAPAGSSITLAAFDQAAPFGQIGQSIILPAGTQAPQLALVVPDPAAIILPNQQGLFVENSANFLTDCATQAANAASGNPALSLAAAAIFSSFQQIAAAQLAGLSGLGIYQGNNPALVGQPLGSAAVAANQGQSGGLNAAPPPLASALNGANQAQPQPGAPAPATPAVPASPAVPAGQPNAGAVIVGSSPGGAAAAQPAAVAAVGANQAQSAVAQPQAGLPATVQTPVPPGTPPLTGSSVQAPLPPSASNAASQPAS